MQNDAFSSLSSSLSHSSRRAAQAFGLSGPGSVRQTRLILYTVAGFFLIWVIWKTRGFWWASSGEV